LKFDWLMNIIVCQCSTTNDDDEKNKAPTKITLSYNDNSWEKLVNISSILVNGCVAPGLQFSREYGGTYLFWSVEIETNKKIMPHLHWSNSSNRITNQSIIFNCINYWTLWCLMFDCQTPIGSTIEISLKFSQCNKLGGMQRNTRHFSNQ
jgi:hypothetical protein